MQMVKFSTVIVLVLSLLTTVSIADEIVHYDKKGRVLKQYKCDQVNAHESSQQDTLICTREARASVTNLRMKVIGGAGDVQNCKNDRNCVVLDNRRDPHWIPIALYGIPDATFGRKVNGGSCAVIRESRPTGSTWDSATWRLCTNNPNVELAYTYALGYSNENVDPRFKAKNARRVCFGDALRGYKHRQFWKDNCIFIRPLKNPVAGVRQ